MYWMLKFRLHAFSRASSASSSCLTRFLKKHSSLKVPEAFGSHQLPFGSEGNVQQQHLVVVLVPVKRGEEPPPGQYLAVTRSGHSLLSVHQRPVPTPLGNFGESSKHLPFRQVFWVRDSLKAVGPGGVLVTE